MELRACNQSHFIAAITGGDIPSIAQRNKEPKVGSDEEISFSYDSKTHDSHAKYPPVVNRSLAMPSGLEKVKTVVKSEYIEDENELDFEGLTLRQVKDFCKSHKRKASGYVNLTTIKQEDSDLQSEVDDLDWKETLHSWKHKVHKKTTARKKGICKNTSKSSTTDKLSGRLNNKSAKLALLDASSEISMPLKIKVEVEECDFSESQARSSVHEPERITSEALIMNHKPEVLSKKTLVFSGPNVRKEVDMTDLMPCDEATTALLEADGSSVQIDHPHHRCLIQPFPNGNASHVVASCLALNGDCQDAEFTNPSEVSMNDNRNIEEIVRINATNFNSTVKLDTNIHSVDGMPSRVKPTYEVGDKQLSVLDVTTEGVPASPGGPKRKFQDNKCFEFGKDRTSTAEVSRDAENYNVAVQDENSLPLVNSVESLHNVTSATEDNQSPITGTFIGCLTSSPDIQPCNDIAQQIGSAASEEPYENKLEQQPPERHFSARMMNSPNSKERLCKTMISAEMQDHTQILFSEGLKATACEEKLCLDKNAVDTLPSRSNVKKIRIIPASKRLQDLHTTLTRLNSRQTLKKWKNEKKLSDGKGTVYGPCVSSSSVQAARACSTSRSCSQNSIEFSQQQMVDIERLSTKLLKELQTMEEMVVDTLQPDSRTCSTSSYYTDKARVAVENVKKVEDTTKRWLSIMARDCTRFCKIMELSETNNASPRKE